MDCVNHPGVNATAYCQNCGKAMCAACVRQEAGGQILCEPCWTAWQSVRAPFVAPPPPGVPNPGVAAVLGLIPGVGAMYNGQFFKGFIHVIIFAVLVSMAGHFGIFGLFIAAWIFYQSFEAYHTARARRDGEPVPDPLGLNELAAHFQNEFRRGQGVPPPPGAAPAAPGATGQAQQPGAAYAPQYSNPYQSGYRPPPFTGAPPAAGFTSGYPPPAAGFTSAYPPPPPAAGYGIPPVPPVPPVHWRRREPIAAIVLIGMGLLFLLGQFDWFNGRMFEFTWPVLLIGLGGWLIVRRMHDAPPLPPGAPASHVETEQQTDKNERGGLL